MSTFDSKTWQDATDFFKTYFEIWKDYFEANIFIKHISGINSFFHSEVSFQSFKTNEFENYFHKGTAEFGDFQTNQELADLLVEQYIDTNFDPDIILEPTCGRGNFILSAIKRFKNIKNIIGIEINEYHTYYAKLNILNYYLTNPNLPKPNIDIILHNFFDYDIISLAKSFVGMNILILGNPPWVTNSDLGVLNSSNLPNKVNYKKEKGLDAITGKGNFDIAENISFKLLETFDNYNGKFCLILKNSVIRNLLMNQKFKNFNIASIKKIGIDSKKEFNANVDSSVLVCDLNKFPEFQATELDLYDKNTLKQFGWFGKNFVSDINLYSMAGAIDGICQFEWRQGLKHDLSQVMELEKKNGSYSNGFNDKIELEDTLIYGLMKSSDLKHQVVDNIRKYVIVTQNKIGQNTDYIQEKTPNTYQYLNSFLGDFNNRKSSIYNFKPKFSIFGIGEYSFKPYKVAISSMYKNYLFSLVISKNHKAVMLDDTCYFLGFDNIEYAAYSLILLNSELTENFLRSITFLDSKRVFTKDILMRIDFEKCLNLLSDDYFKEKLNTLNQDFSLNISMNSYEEFKKVIFKVKKQFELF